MHPILGYCRVDLFAGLVWGKCRYSILLGLSRVLYLKVAQALTVVVLI